MDIGPSDTYCLCMSTLLAILKTATRCLPSRAFCVSNDLFARRQCRWILGGSEGFFIHWKEHWARRNHCLESELQFCF